MSILEVFEDGSGLGMTERIDDAGYEVGTAPRVFTVIFNESDAPHLRPMKAINAPGIPRMGEIHPYGNWIFVVERQTYRIAPTCYEVVITYRQMQSPLDQPWEIQWGFLVTSEQFDTCLAIVDEATPWDSNESIKPFVNAAGQLFDPPIQAEFYDLTLRISRYESYYDIKRALNYTGATNRDIWRTFLPETVRCTKITSDKQKIGHEFYWRTTYDFVIRRDGWRKRILQQGLMVREEVGGKLINAVDANGKTATEPVPLDHIGTALDLSNPVNVPKWRYYKVYHSLPFGALSLA